MLEVDRVAYFLQLSGVSSRDRSLAGEMIADMDRLAFSDERTLSELRWVDKKGKDKIVLEPQQIESVFRSLSQVTQGIPNAERPNFLRRYVDEQWEKKKLADFLSVFEDKKKAVELAQQLQNFDQLVNMTPNNITALCQGLGVSHRAITAIVGVVSNLRGKQDDFETTRQELLQFALDHHTFTKAMQVSCFAQGLTSPDTFTEEKRRSLEIELARSNWMIEPNIKRLEQIFAQSVGLPPSAHADFLPVARRVSLMFDPRIKHQHRKALAVIWGVVAKVYFEKVPEYTSKAMKTVNPFLVRPLFRCRSSAMVYAVGGKIASSLETIWGEALEDLFLAMSAKARGVRNGGIDAVVDRDAYDIKSGPAVMNNDQVNVLQIKRGLIQEERRVPTLDTFRVALAYGRSDQVFGTMASQMRLGAILPARESWHTITGDPLAPEKVYKLCAIVADTVGVSGAIDTANGSIGDDDKTAGTEDDEEVFANLFTSSFDSLDEDIEDEELIMLSAVRDEIKGNL